MPATFSSGMVRKDEYLLMRASRYRPDVVHVEFGFGGFGLREHVATLVQKARAVVAVRHPQVSLVNFGARPFRCSACH